MTNKFEPMTIPDSLIKRVARAIANATYDNKAKAAIKAMREPMIEMLRKADEARYHETAIHQPILTREEIRREWQIMIDTALEND